MILRATHIDVISNDGQGIAAKAVCVSSGVAYDRNENLGAFKVNQHNLENLS